MTRIDAPTATLTAYERSGGGEPVLMLHGGPGCPDYLEPVAALLPGRRVVRFDQRGTGASVATNRRFLVEDYLTDIEAVRSHCRIERWHLFGHSWGALLAQLYARAHRNRVLSLFLSNSALGVGADYRRNQREIGRHNQRLLGMRGAAQLLVWYAGTPLPGSAGPAATKRMFAQVWHIYFLDPHTALAPSPAWLDRVIRRVVRRELVSDPAKALARLKKAAESGA